MITGEVYEFGEFRLDVTERRLSRAGAPISLAPKAHDVLTILLRNSGRLVTKQQMLELVWPESFVEEGILAVHISGLRKALCEGEGGRRFIETVSRSGYRFIEPSILRGRDLQESAKHRRRSPEAYEWFGRGRARGEFVVHRLLRAVDVLGTGGAG